MPNSRASTGRFAAVSGLPNNLRLLTFHTTYACRHSGACCNAGWIEPVDAGRCRFYEAHASGGCTIHRAHGHDWLPQACQQFPRVVTQSPLGISLTMSAFCPTAASLLFGDEPFSIATADDARGYDGLDARSVLPPLLRAGMLMDWASVARWEDLTIATLSTYRHNVEHAVRIIEQASQAVCSTWTPADGPLADALTRAYLEPIEPFEPTEPDEPAVARFLAAHVFACWPMYQGHGIRGALEHLRTVRATLNDERAQAASLKEAFRQSDVRLRHRVTSPA